MNDNYAAIIIDIQHSRRFDEEERFSGLYKEYYPDGSLKEEYIYIKGKLVKILMNNREF